MFEWPDGSKYEGNWDAGKQHGQGRMYNESVVTEAGWWNKGKFVGKRNSKNKTGSD